MSEQETNVQEKAEKRSKLPLILGLVMAAVLGGAGFFAAFSGLIPLGSGHEPDPVVAEAKAFSFVPLPPLVISLGRDSSMRHLKFSGTLEVPVGQEQEVARLMPRVLDVLNGYLRAVNLSDVEEPASLIRLRAQMLRRIQIVVGERAVRDLLVTEFVLN